MAARWATDTFTAQLASGSSHLVIEGSLRDSLHPAVVANPNAFSTSAPVAGRGHVSGKLLGYLGTYPAGSEF